MLNKFFFYVLITFLIAANCQVLKAQLNNEVVAVVDGTKITQSEVDESIAGKLLPLQEQINVLRKVALDNFILTTLLDKEAKKRSVSVEELRKSLTIGKVEVSLIEIEKAYLENASAFASMSPDEAKERLRLDMENQARMRIYRDAIQKLKQQAKVEILFTRFNTPKININDEGPTTGNKNARITIVEFSDFQCGYCRQAFGTVKQLLQNQGSNIKFVYKHSLLSPRSFPAAQASVCAEKQGKFWEYHDNLFALEDFSDASLNKIAEKVGLNISTFKSCVTSEDSRSAVLKDMEEAKRLGVVGTPSFFINGKLIRGAVSLEEFNQIVERELKENPQIVENKK